MPMVRNSDKVERMMTILDDASIATWQDISRVLNKVQTVRHDPLPNSGNEFLRAISQGTAFLTFDFGIDGVSIEIAKYARALEGIYSAVLGDVLGDVPGDEDGAGDGNSGLHFIAGDFHPQADAILRPQWRRCQVEGINGWSKWDEGQWFDGLYEEEMPAGSERSSELASEVYRQATVIARVLGRFLAANEIALLIPVNVASNPGNLALALALVFVSEAMGTVVINSNHDFYWDGGKASADREPGEEPGDRDRFFRNAANEPFFALFQRLYPWNGRRWMQVNINHGQSEKLVALYGLPQERVLEIGTGLGDGLFEAYTTDDVRSARRRMAMILSDGQERIRPRSLGDQQDLLQEWMEKQSPKVIGLRDDLHLDLAADGLIYLLQPTRVIARKRIERNVELIQALLLGPLRATFEQDKQRQIVLHITGPTPQEHQADLETILSAYGELKDHLPVSIAERVFLAFSAGRETHPSLEARGFEPLSIIDIYRLATAILFPSETEGRGLPILESAAVGIPIICSRYQPEEVFAEVVGESLPEELRVRYLLFPEETFSEAFLAEAADLLLHRGPSTTWRDHNREAVRSRFSQATLQASFEKLLNLSFETLGDSSGRVEND